MAKTYEYIVQNGIQTDVIRKTSTKSESETFTLPQLQMRLAKRKENLLIIIQHEKAKIDILQEEILKIKSDLNIA